MADTLKKFLDQDAFKQLVTEVKTADAAVLAAAKAHCDGKDKLYDAAGAAATAETNAKAYTDEKVAPLATTAALNAVDGKVATETSERKAADETLQSNIDATNAKTDKNAEDIAALSKTHSDDKALLDAKDAELEGAISDLDAKVGDIPVVEGQETPATVIEYINKKTEGIATDAALGQLQSDLNAVEADIATIKGDYLKSTDKEELVADIEEVQGAVDELAQTHATDKTALEGAIALKADQTALDDVAGVANAAATKTALQEEVTRATDVESGLRTDVDAIKADYLKATDKTELTNAITAEKERAEAAEESLQTQINTIMNNPDAEGAINSINEFTQYVEEHGEIAEGFRTSINENAEAIADLAELVEGTYETKEDATTKYDEVMAEVAAKAVQADWNQNDPAAADYVKNRTHYVGGEKILVKEITLNFEDNHFSYTHNNNAKKSPGYYVGNYEYFNLDGVNVVVYDGVEYSFEGKLGNLELQYGEDTTVMSGGVIYDNTAPFFVANGSMGRMDFFSDTMGEHTFAFYKSEETVKQLDEKFIPDTIARVTDTEVVAGKVEVLEGQMTEVQGAVATKVEQEAYDAKVTELEGADEAQVERIEALEAKFEGETSVASQIETAKEAAIEAAAQDATTKANTAESNAKAHADGLNTAMNTRVEKLEADSATHALASDVTALAERVTTAEGEIDTLQGEMDVVEGKVAANEEAITAINTELDEKALQSDLDSAVARISANETAIATKASQDELDDAVENIAKNTTDIATANANISANAAAIAAFSPYTAAEVTALWNSVTV